MKSKVKELKSFISLVILFISIFAVGLLWSKSVDAAEYPANPSTFYYDELKVLNSETKTLVTQKNMVYKDSKQQPQVVVAVVKSTGDESIDMYAPELLRKWRIGQKDEDNGILILYAVNKGKRNVRIEVGYGLEGAITDSQAGQILVANQDELKSSDAAKINTGLQKTFNAVATLIDKEYGFKGDKNSLSEKELEKIEHPNRVGFPFAVVIGFIIFIGIGYFGVKRGRGGRNGRGGNHYGGNSGLPWWVFMSSNDDYDDDDNDDDDDFFGGFGGFGGGSSGGGGFSGGGGSSGGGGASI